MRVDRNDNPSIKALWESIGLGLQGLSMALVGLSVYATEVKASLLQCALCTLC
ncbi:DUF3693 domain-containing protein [Vibrio furnissii]|uniref:DUF3693 domain-containing protein n=1 Tax=Vibrio furnissii TaxID=29494 RepID=UPI002573470B|nr:DUF3693 domain-containing protein [Vibrio furnissii]WJG29182.1 DUF3693 domain-containing protein [Vibrio furnissii]